MKTAILSKSDKKDKKWKVIYTENGGKSKTIHFGDSNYEDFTMHKNEDRKQLYLNRHRSKENWLDPKTAGFWSRWLLWNETTLSSSIKDVEKKFLIKIKIIQT